MKKSLFLLFISTIHISYAYAQVPVWEWSDAFGGYHYDVGSGVAYDVNQYIINCGYYYDDTITIGSHVLLNRGANDFYVAKYDVAGNVVWAKREGGDGNDYAISTAADANGNVYVTGYFDSDTLIIGNDTLLDASAGYADMFVAKYNSSGIPQWAKRFGNTDWDIAQSVSVDPSGNIYVAGCYYGNPITIGTTTLTNNGMYDIALFKMDPNGNVYWAIGSGGPLNDMGNAVVADYSGNVIISGGFASASINFPLGTLNNAGPGLPDIFAAKFDANGNELWAKRAGDTDNDHSVAVTVDNSNNVYVGGHYHSTSFPFASGTITNNGMGDVYLLKYDPNGNELWGRGEGGMMHDFGFAVTVDNQNHPFISGMFNSDTLMFGPNMLINHASNQDMFLFEYDEFGNRLQAMSYGGNGDDEMNSIVADPFGSIYATGDWRSNTMSLGNDMYFNSDSTVGYADVFFGKIDFILGQQENISNGYSLHMFPNPSNGVFHLASDKVINQLEVYTAEGEVLKVLYNLPVNSYIDLSDEPAGIYFYKAYSGETTSDGKLIIQH